MNLVYLNLGCIVLSSIIMALTRKNPIAVYINLMAVLINVMAIVIRIVSTAS